MTTRSLQAAGFTSDDGTFWVRPCARGQVSVLCGTPTMVSVVENDVENSSSFDIRGREDAFIDALGLACPRWEASTRWPGSLLSELQSLLDGPTREESAARAAAQEAAARPLLALAEAILSASDEASVARLLAQADVVLAQAGVDEDDDDNAVGPVEERDFPGWPCSKAALAEIGPALVHAGFVERKRDGCFLHKTTDVDATIKIDRRRGALCISLRDTSFEGHVVWWVRVADREPARLGRFLFSLCDDFESMGGVDVAEEQLFTALPDSAVRTPAGVFLPDARLRDGRF